MAPEGSLRSDSATGTSYGVEEPCRWRMATAPDNPPPSMPSSATSVTSPGEGSRRGTVPGDGGASSDGHATPAGPSPGGELVVGAATGAGAGVGVGVSVVVGAAVVAGAVARP